MLTAVSMWQMAQFSLLMDPVPIVVSGLLQGFGLGCTFVPLNTLALSTLPRQILTQATAIRSLMRNLGGSIGISMLVSNLATNTQTVHSRLVEHLRPDNPLVQAPFLPAPWGLGHAGGSGAAQRRGDAAGGDGRVYARFQLMMGAALAVLPLLLLIRDPNRRAPHRTRRRPRRRRRLMPTGAGAARRRKFPAAGNFLPFGPGICGRDLNYSGQRTWQEFPGTGNREPGRIPNRERSTPIRELTQRIRVPFRGRSGRSMPCDCGNFRGVHARRYRSRRMTGPGIERGSWGRVA